MHLFVMKWLFLTYVLITLPNINLNKTLTWMILVMRKMILILLSDFLFGILNFKNPKYTKKKKKKKRNRPNVY